MFPSSFSFHEIHAKHRNPEEIEKIEKENQVLAAWIYQYGDSINNQDKPEAHKSIRPGLTIPLKGTRHASPFASFFTHLFMFFTSRA